MKRIIIGILVIGIGFLTVSGFERKDPKVSEKATYSILQKWELPAVLNEVSGIDWIGENTIAAVQDEDGIIFIYDLERSELKKQIKFHGNGDYEGIRISGEDAYILRSDGVIFKVAGFLGPNPETTKHNTTLAGIKGINVEGLCMDHENTRLLIAEKERKGKRPTRGIYAVSLNLKRSWEEPAIRLDLNNAVLKQVKGKTENRFFPSEMAVHPKTDNYYLLDGKDPKLLILEPGGEPEKLYVLEKEEFAQPEGITFDPSGDLYISNEAGKDPANILKVRLQ